jgi:hypothetical protein
MSLILLDGLSFGVKSESPQLTVSVLTASLNKLL